VFGRLLLDGDGLYDGSTRRLDAIFSCPAPCVVDSVSFYGVAEGGDVTISVDGVVTVVPTAAGQTASEVAEAVAAAVGGGAVAEGDRVVTWGTIDSVLLNDPGLFLQPQVPALSAPALGMLMALLALAAAARPGRRSSSRSGHPS
jgi:hypothetical protein